MKIAMMTNNYKPFIGGVPVSIERLAEGLRKRGHEVCVFAPDYGRDEKEQDVVRYRAGKSCLKNGMVIPNALDYKIRREFEERDFDLIHVHQPMLIGNISVHLSRKYKIPLVFTYHTRYEEYLHYLKIFAGADENKKVRNYLMRQGKKVIPHYMNAYIRQCSMVFAPSLDIERRIGESQNQVPVSTLPTGLSEDAYAENRERTKEIRQQYGEEGKSLLCTVSRLEKEKNLYFLLDAVKRLQEKQKDTCRLLIVGDGAERKALEEYGKRMGIRDCLSFTGNVPNEEVKDYLFASDLFLFSSTSETQGIVLAEAMAAGKPVVAVEACGVNDIVKDGVNGYLTREDKEEYARRVSELLTEENLRKQMKESALETAKNYTMSSVAEKAEKEYQKVLWQERRATFEQWEEYEKSGAVSAFLRLFKVS